MTTHLDLSCFTANERKRLQLEWQPCSYHLLRRDRNDRNYRGGGHGIKGNPVLIAAIEATCSAYLALFNGLQLSRYADRLSYAIQMHNNKCKLIDYGHLAFTNLCRDNYGFNSQEISKILAVAPTDRVYEEPIGLPAAEAEKIIGSSILISIQMFNSQFASEMQTPIAVPKKSLQRTAVGHGFFQIPCKSRLPTTTQKLHPSF